MTIMEQETLDVIAQNEDRIHYYIIAQELKISAHYAYVICKGLERSAYVDFDTFKGICSLTEKGKEAVEKNWIFKLKSQKENIKKSREENKKRILKNVETINY
jgi:Mn-dependent DtxR family transcriptional regulator